MTKSRDLLFGQTNFNLVIDVPSFIFTGSLIESAKSDDPSSVWSQLKEAISNREIDPGELEASLDFKRFLKNILSNPKFSAGDNVVVGLFSDSDFFLDLKNNLIQDILLFQKDESSPPFVFRPLFNRPEALEEHLVYRFKHGALEKLFSEWCAEFSLIEERLDRPEASRQSLFKAVANLISNDKNLGVEPVFLSCLQCLDPGPGGFGFDPNSFENGLFRFRQDVVDQTYAGLNNLENGIESELAAVEVYKQGLKSSAAFLIACSFAGSGADQTIEEMIDSALQAKDGQANILRRSFPILEAADLSDHGQRINVIDELILYGPDIDRFQLENLFKKIAEFMIESLFMSGEVINQDVADLVYLELVNLK